jgi:predicted DCC family thiol-disulfide oxidoreductase YuxK
VEFVVRRDSERVFHFAPLQGETARRLLPPEFIRELRTVSLWSPDQLLTQSDAALAILRQLRGWAFLQIFWWVPRPLRDYCYRWVAGRRYSLFGRRETCRLPTPEEREYFLD